MPPGTCGREDRQTIAMKVKPLPKRGAARDQLKFGKPKIVGYGKHGQLISEFTSLRCAAKTWVRHGRVQLSLSFDLRHSWAGRDANLDRVSSDLAGPDADSDVLARDRLGSAAVAHLHATLVVDVWAASPAGLDISTIRHGVAERDLHLHGRRIGLPRFLGRGDCRS